MIVYLGGKHLLDCGLHRTQMIVPDVKLPNVNITLHSLSI